jgi:hypothetical protein
MIIGRAVTGLDVRLPDLRIYLSCALGGGPVCFTGDQAGLVSCLSGTFRLFPVVSGPRAESVLIPLHLPDTLNRAADAHLNSII